MSDHVDIEILLDKNGLKEIYHYGPKGKKSIASRGPLDEEYKDIVVEVVTIGTMVKALRAAGCWVVCTNLFEPGD